MKKVSIQNVENGYIARITDQGKSLLKTEHGTPTYVFTTFTDLVMFLRHRFADEGEVEIREIQD